jgi:hypothetical protein
LKISGNLSLNDFEITEYYKLMYNSAKQYVESLLEPLRLLAEGKDEELTKLNIMGRVNNEIESTRNSF